MSKGYDVYRGNNKVGDVWEKPNWDGEIVGFILSWLFYLVARAFVLAFRGIRALYRRN